MNTNDQIFARMKSHGTLLCCGLDPDLKRMPTEILEQNISDEEKVLAFTQSVVNATVPHVCAYKVQKAFFDLLSGGHETLRELICYIHREHPGVPVIVDCKIGDIDNTMAAYIHNIFDILQADGVLANPYMGDDAIIPLAELANKSIGVLVRTSNPSGGVIQDVPLENGQPLWRHVLDLVVNRWNQNSNMVPVLSSTVGLNMASIRPLIPGSMPILFAGVGAQGGSYADLGHLLNSQGTGVFVNSSRGILYPQSQGPWQEAIRTAAIELKGALNNQRRSV